MRAATRLASPPELLSLKKVAGRYRTRANTAFWIRISIFVVIRSVTESLTALNSHELMAADISIQASGISSAAFPDGTRLLYAYIVAKGISILTAAIAIAAAATEKTSGGRHSLRIILIYSFFEIASSGSGL